MSPLSNQCSKYSRIKSTALLLILIGGLLPIIGCHGSGDSIPNINNAAA
ncbi:MAG: hypothetical protein GWP35_01300, partial [Proteobacteria bacterium]|nr:hypothetical protein [Pseudomonadota bacterium]